MVLKTTVWLMIVALAGAGCLGTAPPARLGTTTPIALVVHLESAGGEAIEVPDAVLRAVNETLSARNLRPVAVGRPGLLDGVRSTPQRLERVLLAATDETQWLMLIEARARFFSQLSGRFRWEVELRSSLVSRAAPAQVHTSDLGVAAFLLHEHEGEREALAFVRRQLAEDVADLVDRVLIVER